jgi:hypothetical protein
MSTEDSERLAGTQGVRGPRGPAGKQGKAGKRPPMSLLRAFGWLLILNFALWVVLGGLLFMFVNQNHDQRCSAVEQDARIPLLKDAGPANPSRLDINIMIMADRHRAETLHCK